MRSENMALFVVVFILMHIHCNYCKADSDINHLEYEYDTLLELPAADQTSLGSQIHESAGKLHEERTRAKFLRLLLERTLSRVDRHIRDLNRAISIAELPTDLLERPDGFDAAATPPSKRGTARTPLRKRELSAIERAVIRQEILRRMEESKSPVEIPLGLRFRRLSGTDDLTGASKDPFVSSFFAHSYRLGGSPGHGSSMRSRWSGPRDHFGLFK
ncbi:uncharacterized protein [Diadema setosum]|uniref:uncharacterized protein n=1 Tax=Diadema setosum TaxID=31175 RepID=UPI003B3BAFDD